MEVVRPVKHHVAAGDELLDIGVVDIGNDGLDLDARVYLGEACVCGDGFWQAIGCIGLLKERLPLEVRELDEIAVHYSQLPNTCASQHLGVRSPKGSAAQDQNTRLKQLSLTFGSDLAKEYLAAVAFVDSGFAHSTPS
jgi:hypothetical protein